MKSADSKSNENSSRAIANQYSGKDSVSLLSPGNVFILQPKQIINQPNDIYEQEAGSVADQIMSMSTADVQTKPLLVSALQRRCAHCEEEEQMQRKKFNSESSTADDDLENYVENLSSSGHVVQQKIYSVSADGVVDEGRINEDEIMVDGENFPGQAQGFYSHLIQRQNVSMPPTIRVVANHQFPITAANISAGLLSGNGGVSEMEVSDGSTDFTGQQVSEVFIGEGGDNSQVGGCNNANGQGGQGGSTFTIGDPVSFSRLGININLPSKLNTFYDVHIKAFGRNVLPPGIDHQYSSCLQQYTMGGMLLNNGEVFDRYHNIDRINVSGQDVANINLVK